MLIEKTLCLLKPDVCERNLEHEIIQDIQQEGFEVICFKKKKLTIRDIEVLYAESRQQPYYKYIVEYLSEGPVIFF